MGTEPKTATSEHLKHTPLFDLHTALGAKMVPFAGYAMPVHFKAGILAEHLHVRKSAGLFDVSHMGQAKLSGLDHDITARALEARVPGNILTLAPGRVRYTVLLNDDGGIIDDLMVTRPEAQDGTLRLIVNAACKQTDYALIAKHLPAGVELAPSEDLALLALQGPKAVDVLARHSRAAADLSFMAAMVMELDGIECQVSRSGYTGEDGFELSVAARHATALAMILLEHSDVEPAGLGARDSLRLEAGLCLWGHDIDETTNPIEANLSWVIPKRRREAADFPGAGAIMRELAGGPARLRVGIRPNGRAPAREGTLIMAKSGDRVGAVTSGGFGPSVGGPVAMGYVSAEHATTGNQVVLMIRGKPHEGEIVELPFVPHRYRKPK